MEKLVKHSILLTQTRPPVSRDLLYWGRQGYDDVHYQSLLNVQPLPVEPLEIEPQAIVLTSVNGALALEYSDWDRTIPVFGVGIATSQTAKAVGFLDCSSPSDKPYPSALNLINWIKKNLIPEDGPIVFGCGEHLRHDIGEALKPFGFTTIKIMLYSTQAVADFNEPIKLALKNNSIDSVVINSEQSLKVFSSLCQKNDIRINDFTIIVPSDFLKNSASELGYLSISVVQQNQVIWKKRRRFTSNR